jgi:hypothetical protein
MVKQGGEKSGVNLNNSNRNADVGCWHFALLSDAPQSWSLLEAVRTLDAYDGGEPKAAQMTRSGHSAT